MLPFYLFEPATGRVLGTGEYNERGDAAAVRAFAFGAINPRTHYVPAGVKTARPAMTLAIDKSTLIANGVDNITITAIATATLVAVYKDNDTLPRGLVRVSDGTLAMTVDKIGSYRIVLRHFPHMDSTFTVSAT